MSEQGSPERKPLDIDAVESSPGTDLGDTPKKGQQSHFLSVYFFSISAIF